MLGRKADGLFPRLSTSWFLSVLLGKAQLLREPAEDHEHDARGGRVIHKTNRTKLPAKATQTTLLIGYERPCTPNVSQLSKDIETSRATVMNYIKYLTDARLMNMLYPVGESFPKKPSKVYMYNSNLMYPIRPMEVNAGAVRESFFYNQLLKDNKLNEGIKNAHFLVNTMYNFRIEENMKVKNNPDMYYAVDKTEIGEGNMIPLWLFGFLY